MGLFCVLKSRPASDLERLLHRMTSLSIHKVMVAIADADNPQEQPLQILLLQPRANEPPHVHVDGDQAS